MSRSKLKILIGAFLVVVLVLAPVATAIAASFTEYSDVFSSGYLHGSKLTINKTNPKLDKTINVKLKLKVNGERAVAGLEQHLYIWGYDQTLQTGTETILPTVTNSKGKATWKFKLSNYINAFPGDEVWIGIFGETTEGVWEYYGVVRVVIK